MGELALDVETTFFNKGNPYDSRNKFVCWSWACSDSNGAQKWLKDCHGMVAWAKVIVGFNFKFDYHWLAKEGIDLSKSVIWDVQIAEFILSNQTNRFPSLNATCERYGIPLKKDVVKEEYWDKGINTDLIPWDILSEYASHDAQITLQCYHAQRKLMTPKQIRLCQLMCEDMHVLREMEATGLAFDEDLCLTRSKEVDDQISEINGKLTSIYPHVPINFSSNDHMSAFLYGGTIKQDTKEMVGYFKTGEKKGQPKFKNTVVEHFLPRLYEPLKGSEMLKEGMFATDASTLQKLKGNKTTVGWVLDLAKLEKTNGTYYKGLIALREKMYWPKGILHGQFNQCMAATGRLSCSNPNLQNFQSSLQDIFISDSI